MDYEKPNCNSESEGERNIIIRNVPFATQLFDKENFQDLGFENLAEAEYWSKRDCGIVCIEMAVWKVPHMLDTYSTKYIINVK